MYMSDAFLDKPELAAKTMEAYFKAVAFWKENPEEGNKIIAKGLNFPVADVEKVIGKDGEILKGGIWVFDAEQAGKFMGVIPGELPLGPQNGQMAQHWETTTDWWLKFGLIDERHPIDAGVNTAPLEAVLSE